MRRHKPLNLDEWSSIRVDGHIPDMEIVRRDENCDTLAEGGNCSDGFRISNCSDQELDEKIETYKKHITKLNMKDGNKKLWRLLQKYEEEKARRNAQKKTGSQEQVIEDVNASPRLSSLEIRPAFLESNAVKGASPGIEERRPISELRLSSPNPTKSGPSLFSSVNSNMSSPGLRGDGNGKSNTNAGDVEQSPSKVNNEAGLARPMQTLASRLLNHVDAGGNRMPFSHCKQSNVSSGANISTPMKTQLCKEHLCGSPREPSGGRSGVVKRGQRAVGQTPDTAMELSDDEENQGCLAFVSQASSSSHVPIRQGLRSATKRFRKLSWRVAYPSSDDPDAVEVQSRDLNHLRPSEFLNDTVIDFYIKYIQVEKIPSLEKSNHLYFFNSFFYKKLTTEKQVKDNDCFSKLRKWTKGANIFEKSYLFMPIHDRAHWSLAIICFPWVDDRNSVTEPYILHLDSMSSTSGHATQDIFNVLKSYLEAEWVYLRHEHDTANEILKLEPSKSIHKRVQVPLQDNEWDCGLFMLYYIERFAQEAPVPFKPSGLDEMFGRFWFKPSEASQLRGMILKLLESLFDYKLGVSETKVTGKSF